MLNTQCMQMHAHGFLSRSDVSWARSRQWLADMQ